MMVQAVESGGPRSDVRTQSVAQTLLAETASAFATVTAEGSPSTDNGEVAVQVMRRYLEDNLARPVRVRDLAAQVHLSERHAARLFRLGDRRDGRWLPAPAAMHGGGRASARARRLDRHCRQRLRVLRPAPFHPDLPGPVRRESV